MIRWWDSLDIFMQVLYCIAIPSTILLIIQTILIIIGYDGGDGVDGIDGIDGMGDIGDVSDMSTTAGDIISGHPDVDYYESGFHHDISDAADFRLFTFQGMVAFFCVFSWTSIGGIHSGMNKGISLLIGLLFGMIIMFLIGKVIQWSRNLSQSGTMDLRNALGETAQVYIPIPPAGKGSGKINVTLQGSLSEMTAISYGDKQIETGETVRVIDIKGDALVVERD